MSYGAPYIGNRAFCRQHAQLIPESWLLMNNKDPITRIGKMFWYKKSGCAACCC